MVPPIPPGFHTLTPYLVVKDATAAMDFYKRAFGATEIMAMRGPDGRMMHAELRIGDSPLMLSGEWPEFGNKAPLPDHVSVSLHLYVPDVDASFAQAVAAGCQPVFPVSDTFWGDRYGKLLDPFGHVWGVATHKEDLSEAEIAQRAARQFGG